MKKTKMTSGNCGGLVLAMIAFCAGVVIFLAIPVVGWVLGPLICIGALFMGGRTQKIWRCNKCRAFIPRA